MSVDNQVQLHSDINLQEAAQRVANVYANIVNNKIGCKIPVPVQMKFNLELDGLKEARASGCAYSADMSIGINMTLFRENVSYVLNTTIPHEIGHLIQFDKFYSKGLKTHSHGIHWMEAMKLLGKTPVVTHNLDVTNAILAYKNHIKNKKEEK